MADRLSVLGLPKRIALLDALRNGEATVQELADLVGLSHQMASYHLTTLYRGGLLSRRRDGAATLYAVDDWSSWWVVEQLAESLSDEDA